MKTVSTFILTNGIETVQNDQVENNILLYIFFKFKLFHRYAIILKYRSNQNEIHIY